MAPARRPYAFDDRRHLLRDRIWRGTAFGATRLIASGLALKTIAEGTDQKVITEACCKAHERLDNPPWLYIVYDLNPPRDESEGQGLRLRSPGSSI
jgi:hypothetical protein